MELRLKEEPREWRKSVLLTVPGLAVIISVLHWRQFLPANVWLLILLVLALIALAAVVWPRWFRGYYRASMRLGYALSHVLARVVLFLVFVCLVTPLALVFRLTGKDTLRLKRRTGVGSYWAPGRDVSQLDRMF